MEGFNALDLFAGAGGASLGLRAAGFHHLACYEWSGAACATMQRAGLPAVQADLRTAELGEYRGRVDLLWASPPCQAGSLAGKRRGANDERNGWPWTLRHLQEVAPTWVLAENVLGWTYHDRGCLGDETGCPGCLWERKVLPGIRCLYPYVGWWTLNAADYGVPQQRRRVILWAGPLPLPADGPRPTHGSREETDLADLGLLPWRSMRDAIGDTLTRESCEERVCYPCDGSHGQACAEPWRLDWPAPTVTTTEAKGTRASSGSGWTISNGPDRASDTAFLVAGIRRIEVSEGAALQGFPAGWLPEGTVEEQYRQIGNAVPPPLAQAVAKLVLGYASAWRELVATYGEAGAREVAAQYLAARCRHHGRS